MAYLQSLSAQASLCFRTVGFGFLLGVLYDFVRLVRALLARKSRRFCWDVGYALLAAVCTFLFFLTVDGGRVRVFLLGALTVGFLVWLLGAGKPFRRGTDRLLIVVRRFSASVRTAVRPIILIPKKYTIQIRFRAKKVIKKCKYLLHLHG